MSKIIIYDNKNNILIADLDGRVAVEHKKINEYITENEYKANFRKCKIIQSESARKHIRRIEKIFKYHKKVK